VEWLTEPLTQEAVQRGLVGGILAVITTSVVGTWVVIRGLGFMGDALAHGVLPGLALALLLGFAPSLGAIAGAAVMILGIEVVHRKARVREDVAISLLFVGMLALGVLIASGLPDGEEHLEDLLFGDALAASTGDLLVQGIAAAVTLAAVALLYRALMALSFNEAKARMLGLRPGLAHLAMLAMLTAAIVASFRTVGTLLVFGLLVGPPATASLIVRRVPTMMGAAVLIGIVGVLAGLLISWHTHTEAGAMMALTSVAIFFAVLTAREMVVRPLARRRAGRG
jgi:ABC-type Mn2+/Zn2+ transport system permease subunit